MTSIQNLIDLVLAFINANLIPIVTTLIVIGIILFIFKISFHILKWLVIIAAGLWLGLTVLNYIFTLFI